MTELMSTGFLPLDEVLGPLEPGGHIWNVDSVDHYRRLLALVVTARRVAGLGGVYVRFADHDPVVNDEGMTIVQLNPNEGFESFIEAVHQVVWKAEPGTFIVFDLLDDSLEAAFTDQMRANFFSLTLPFIEKRGELAFFAKEKNRDTPGATRSLEELAKGIVDLFWTAETLFFQPKKVGEGAPADSHGLFELTLDGAIAVQESARVVRIVTSSPWAGLQSASYRTLGSWDRHFLAVRTLLHRLGQQTLDPKWSTALLKDLVTRLLSRDGAIVPLLMRYFSLEDVVQIWSRTIGSGTIGGKAVGMLLARQVLLRDAPKTAALLEPHDSFFIASDVFYTFLVHNDCWWIREQQKHQETMWQAQGSVTERIMAGKFPDDIMRRLADLLDYFGNAPIIVRSSSLLEDNFGNAFAGKYESVFCANQGSRAERLDNFVNAMKTVYASAMSEPALTYRLRRGILDRDEQMALLVQRVSGAAHDDAFFPHLAGVSLSYNPYPWDKRISPEAGVMRLVFGLGTRAVDRSDDDYTRVVALNAPTLRPVHGQAALARKSQRRVDLLRLSENRVVSVHLSDLLKVGGDIELSLFAHQERPPGHSASEMIAGGGQAPFVLDFTGLFRTEFVAVMRRLLSVLRAAYGTEVEVEFTANFDRERRFQINLVQCRPFQMELAEGHETRLPEGATARPVLTASGAVVGRSRRQKIGQLIYVRPERYAALNEAMRYQTARCVEQLVANGRADGRTSMLVGPGRWGTSTPSLGVPIGVRQLQSVVAICEVDTMHQGLMPDLSLGTHFFHEMVELNILYIGLLGQQADNFVDGDFFAALAPPGDDWPTGDHPVGVWQNGDGGGLILDSDMRSQIARLLRTP